MIFRVRKLSTYLFVLLGFLFLFGLNTSCGNPETTCSKDSDCAQGEVCKNQKCEKKSDDTGCKSKADCKDGQQCDTATGKCVECLTDGDCPDDKECKDNTCKAKANKPECTTDDDCKDKEKKFCSDDQKCEWACKADSDCKDGEECKDHECKAKTQEGCTKDDDCTDADKSKCDTTTKKCVQCLADDDCTDADKSKCYTKEKKCVQCLADGDCQQGEECKNYECKAKGCSPAGKKECKDDQTSRECQADGTWKETSCQANETCDKASGECKAKAQCQKDADCANEAKKFCSDAGKCEWDCKADGDCKKGEVCKNHECKVKPECQKDDDCTKDPKKTKCDVAKGVCVGCLANADCQKGEECKNNVCQVKPECTKDADCAGNADKAKCDTKKQKCVGCLADADCTGKAKPFCSPAQACEWECKQNSDCKNGATCNNHVCTSSCKSDADCGGALPKCNLSSKKCVACLKNTDCKAPTPVCMHNMCVECYRDSDCKAPKNKCVAYTCTEPPKKTRKEGESCLLPYPKEAGYNDCATGLKCYEHICFKTCKTSSDCTKTQGCSSSYKICLEKCDPAKGIVAKNCKDGFFCKKTTGSDLKPGYCKPLPFPKKGTKPLGDKNCSNYYPYKYCDASKGLFCDYPTCAQACDPRKNKADGTNPACQKTEECVVEVSQSHLGGACQKKPTQKLGETCDTNNRCLKGLKCYSHRCYKECKKDSDCQSPQVCYSTYSICVDKCDPQNGKISKDCKKYYYCKSSYALKGGYCSPLKLKPNGSKKLGDHCSNYTDSLACDGSKGLYCDMTTCRKACDPRDSKADGSNPACAQNEACQEETYNSYLGGKCLKKPTQKLGETCDNENNRCVSGLECYLGRCATKCSTKQPCPSKSDACYYGRCLAKCDPKNGTFKTCKTGYYCNAISYGSAKPGVCKPLPPFHSGSQKLGDSCSTTKPCDGSKKLYCSGRYSGKCVKACDPRKTSNGSNSDCSSTEECVEETTYSPLGGVCKKKSSQNIGDPCNSTDKRCKAGLICYNSICYKKCSQNSDCSSSQACYSYRNICVTKCDPKKGPFDTCQNGYYCSKSYSVSPGYCEKLPPFSQGKNDLGDACSKSKPCDGSKKLYCTGSYSGKCVKACDPRKTSNGSNPDCSSNEECNVDTYYSPLGGKCVSKGSKNIGEACNSTDQRCKSGLICYNSICYKKCSKDSDCSSSQACYSYRNICVTKCDPKKGTFASCTSGYYCTSSSVVSPGYCNHLPPKKKGPKKLGETCSNYTSSQFCNGDAGLVCNYPKCVKACDPRKTSNGSNPACSSSEECIEDTSISFLGGKCVSKGTKKLGEACNSTDKRCISGLYCYSGKCVGTCDPAKATPATNPDCSTGTYCYTYSSSSKGGICKPLPPKQKGPKKLGEACSTYTSSRFCNGDAGLVCKYPKCVKACDPRKTSNGSNPACSSSEECIEDTSISFLGGYCLLKGTKKVGEACNSTDKRCLPGLSCDSGFCYKSCANSSCTSPKACYPYGKICVDKCDPAKNKITTCPQGYYCASTSTNLKPGYCRHLPEFKYGTKKLGESCSNYTVSKFCDGKANLYCDYPKCVKACDPRKSQPNGSHPACASGEKCNITTSSPLGGQCSK